MLRAISKKLKKTRAGQTLLEFCAVASIMCLIMFGTIDLFNYAISYMQLTYFSDLLMNMKLQNKYGYSSYSIPNLGNLVGEGKKEPFPSNAARKDFQILRLEFIFQNKNKGKEIEFKKLQTGNNTGRVSVGTMHCATASRKLALIYGDAVYGQKDGEISKGVCAIQESADISRIW